MRKMLPLIVLLSFLFVSSRDGFSEDNSPHYDQPKDLDLAQIWKVWELIRINYVDDKKLDNETLIRGIIKGLIWSLGDKHGFLFRTEDFKNFVAATHSGVTCEMLVVRNKDDKDFKVGHLKINDFTKTTDAEVRQALKSLRVARFSRLILDLSSNTGGMLEVAYGVSGAFLGPDKVVAIKSNRQGEEELLSVGKKICPDVPIVCLINESSASAAEIVAGALRDHGRARLVGKTSRGKGSIQTSFLTEVGVIMITTDHWVTPKRTPVDGCGLKPDIEIEKSENILQEGIDTIIEM